MADWNQSDMLAYADDVVQGRLSLHLHQKMVLLNAERPDDEYVAKYFENYGGQDGLAGKPQLLSG